MGESNTLISNENISFTFTKHTAVTLLFLYKKHLSKKNEAQFVLMIKVSFKAKPGFEFFSNHLKTNLISGENKSRRSAIL